MAAALLALWTVAFAAWAPLYDSHAYYAVNWPPSYAASTIAASGWAYSPPIALLIQPFHLLPFWVFGLLVTAGSAAALWYMVGPWAALLAILPPFSYEFAWGNIDLIAGALIVMALERPVAWVPVLLTKVTPGVGLAWHLFRREWGALAVAVVVSAALLLVTLPSTIEWFRWLVGADTVGQWLIPPLWVRGLLAVGAIAYGARHGYRWTVPLAVAACAHGMGLGWLVALGAWRLRRSC